MPIRLPSPKLSPLVTLQFIGKVVDNSFPQTAIVAIDKFRIHPKYAVLYRKVQTLWAHDEEDICNVGDIVKIQYVNPPITERKDHIVSAILRRENIFDIAAANRAKEEVTAKYKEAMQKLPSKYQSIIPLMTPPPPEDVQTHYQWLRKYRRAMKVGQPFPTEVYPPPSIRPKLFPKPRGAWKTPSMMFKKWQ